MRQLVNDDHLQKFRGSLPEDRRYPDFMFCLEFAALHPGYEGVAAQGVLNDMDLAVVGYPAQRLCRTQKLVLYRHGKIVERFVGPDVMSFRILLHQKTAQSVFREQLAHPCGDLL